MMYQLIIFSWETAATHVNRDNGNGSTTSIPFDPANTDYANFKAQILADEAELQDADGVLMTAEEAKAFVATLP